MTNIFFYSTIVCLTIIAMWTIINISNRNRIRVAGTVLHRQSNIHEIIKHLIPKNLFEKPQMLTQSRKHNQKNMVKVVMFNNMAYWVVENVFYVAETINGKMVLSV